MTRQLILVLLALSLTTFLGCSSGSSPTEPPQQAIFRGLILDFDNEAPIVDATVTIQGRSTMSAADGTCSIGGLDPGATAVVTMKQGYGIVEANITLMPGENAEVRIHLRELGSGS